MSKTAKGPRVKEGESVKCQMCGEKKKLVSGIWKCTNKKCGA